MKIIDTINDALIELGVINPNDEASPQDHEYGLRTLNRIIDQYNAQGIMITYLQEMVIKVSTDITQWKNDITIGHLKDIDTVAPIGIEQLFWRLGATDYQSKNMSVDNWASISYKESQAIPRQHYVRKLEDNSLEVIFDCVPIDGLELHIMAKKPYVGVNDTGNNFAPTDDINWSFGFEKMLMTRLALELAPSYETNPSQVLVAKQQEAEDIVKRKNFNPQTLQRRSGYGKKRRLDNPARY